MNLSLMLEQLESPVLVYENAHLLTNQIQAWCGNE